MSKLELTRLCRTRADGPLPGDDCPVEGCEGRIVVYCIRERAGFTFRYLKCKKCKNTPRNNKFIMPTEEKKPVLRDSTNTPNQPISPE